MLTLIIKQSQYTKALKEAISTEVIQSGKLTIAGMTLLITGIKLDVTYHGEDIIAFDYHVPEKLTIPND